MPRGYSKERPNVRTLQNSFFWCPKYWKQVLTGDMADRLESLIEEKVAELELETTELAIRADNIHLSFTGYSKLASKNIVQQIKSYSCRVLRDEYDFGLPVLWTRSFFVSSVGGVSSQIIEGYIGAQTGQ